MSERKIDFSMNYYALKTFGKQQYSNAWAALSELVANGFDAEATDVFLYIDMINKNQATIEIYDNGTGMDESDLQSKYSIIGRNRRLSNQDDNAAGRKGIGKLAALYLSDEYQIITNKNNNLIAWGVNVSQKSDQDIPHLDEIDIDELAPECTEFWDNISKGQGTLIRLLKVDLTRIGDRAIDALKQRLSNYFLFATMAKKLHICILRTPNDKIDFELVQKQIAFDNMSHIYYSDIKYVDARKDTFEVEFTDKSKNKKTLEIKKNMSGLPTEISDAITGNKILISGSGTFYGKTKSYTLEGWVGVHSSIDNATAQKNDERYIRNGFYNPNQLRVYVRNKLANENVLSRLNLTGTYANYIEGEVSFDILDDNDFEDIATSNRQDFSVIDERVSLLLGILRGLCRQLIDRRQELADLINKEKNDTDIKIQSKQKTGFAKETHRDLLDAGIPEEKANELSTIISNKLKGEYELKTSYKLFISHASRDRIFTDFVSYYLKNRGFRLNLDDLENTDIFYSSDGTDITNRDPLSDIIKKMIIDDNTDILFFTSQNFLNSEYCLFEGGAAWATRAVLEYVLISVDFDKMPKFLTNGKSEFTFNCKDVNSFTLNEQSYKNIVTILNRFIEHLNKNREQMGLENVSLIPEAVFEDKVKMKLNGKEPKDYMDSEILTYWQTYVIDQIDTYLKQYNP